MELHEKLIYTNNKMEALELSLSSVYTLNAINGRNEVEFAREVTLQGKIFSMTSEREFLKNVLLKTFNPHVPGTLLYINELTGVKRFLEGNVSDIQTSIKNNLIHFSIAIESKQPWKEKAITKNIAVFTPMFHFPLILKPGGIVMGYKPTNLEALVDNRAEVPTGFKCRLVATNGTVINPWIINKDSNRKVKINYAMAKNDVIEIISTDQEKKLFINGKNGFKYIDIDTDFFILEVGKNVIGYGAETNVINLDVILYYTPYFLHV